MTLIEKRRKRKKETEEALDKIYSNPKNQPSKEYMRKLKRKQAKAIKEDKS